MSTTAQPQQQQISQAEIDKITKRFNLDDDILEALFGQAANAETRKVGLNKLIRGVVEESVATSGIFHKGDLDAYDRKIQPTLAGSQTLIQRRFMKDFFQEHPHLKDHESIVKTLGNTLQGDFKTTAEYATALATQSEALIKSANPNFVAPDRTVPVTQAAPSTSTTPSSTQPLPTQSAPSTNPTPATTSSGNQGVNTTSPTKEDSIWG